MKKVSIIIVSHNTKEYLSFCIASIRRYTRKDLYRIIVIDNTSTDGFVEGLQEQEDLSCITNKVNVGALKGRNQGIALAEDTDVLLLSSDTIVTPNWLDNLQNALYSNEKIGMVGCVTNHISDDAQAMVPGNYRTIEELEEFSEMYNKSNPSKWKRRTTLGDFCCLIKHEVIEKVGIFDEVFSSERYGNDDYSLRVLIAGYDVLLCKDTYIHYFGIEDHIQGANKEEQWQNAQKYNILQSENKKLLANKWGMNPSMISHYKEMQPDIWKAEYYFLLGDYDNALSSAFIAIGTDHPQATHTEKIYRIILESMIESYYGLEDEMRILKNALTLYPGSAVFLGYEGCFLAKNGEWDKGKELLERALMFYEQNATEELPFAHEENKFRTALAECYFRLGERNFAAGQYVRVLQDDRWYLDALEGYYLLGPDKNLLLRIYANKDDWKRMIGVLNLMGIFSDEYVNYWDLDPNMRELGDNIQFLFVSILGRNTDFSDSIVRKQMKLLPACLQELVYIYYGKHGNGNLPLNAYRAMSDTVNFLGTDDVKKRYQNMILNQKNRDEIKRVYSPQEIYAKADSLENDWRKLSADKYDASLLRNFYRAYGQFKEIDFRKLLSTLYQFKCDGKFLLQSLKDVAPKDLLLSFAQESDILSDLERYCLLGKYELAGHIAAKNIWNIACEISCMLVEDELYGVKNQEFKKNIKPILPQMCYKTAFENIPETDTIMGRAMIRKLNKWHISVRDNQFFNKEDSGI